MSQALDTTAPLWTAADLVEQLGPIPLQRIISHPAPGAATVEDVVRMDDHEDRLCELIDGTLVEKTMGAFESYLAVELVVVLASFVKEQNLGIALGADGMMQLFPNQVRIPDVSFLSWASLEGSGFPDQAVPEMVPDLAAEIISRGNTQEEMDRKLREYFAAGVRRVWYFYPHTKTVNIYAAPDQVTTLTESDTLDGGEVLPGFTFHMSRFFAPPKQAE